MVNFVIKLLLDCDGALRFSAPVDAVQEVVGGLKMSKSWSLAGITAALLVFGAGAANANLSVTFVSASLAGVGLTGSMTLRWITTQNGIIQHFPIS